MMENNGKELPDNSVDSIVTDPPYGLSQKKKRKLKMETHKFIRNTKYYTGVVYEWNLPAGHSCPFALECKVKVNRETGKFERNNGSFRCYAASSERFPAVREHRWRNFEFIKNGGIPEIPKNCKAVRIHASGDFFSQAYFDMWLDICRKHPNVEFWAFTKSLQFWLNRINEIPDNLVLTASYGGKYDHLIEKNNLKYAKVVPYYDGNMPIDTNDDYARIKDIPFMLLDNHIKRK